jgi:apolipoprotein N-acyltransferase
MTDEHARKTANVVMGLAAVGAAYYVLRTPRLRRVAFQFVGAALTSTVPVWLSTEWRRAWAESGRSNEAA